MLSCVINPELLNKGIAFQPDVVSRARTILQGIDGNSGAYTHSQGLLSVRRNVAQFIEQRDQIKAKVDPEDLFLTDGASVGVRLLTQCLIRNANGIYDEL